MHTSFTYELDNVEHIVLTLLATPGESYSSYQDDIQKLLRSEVEKVKKTLLHEVFRFEDETHLGRYIQFHQQELVRILDLLHENHPGDIAENSSNSGDNQMYAMRMIEELLNFIERHFTRYFNHDAKAPETYIALAGSEILNSFNEYQEAIRKLEVDPALVSLLLAPLRKFIERTFSTNVTYRDILYVKEINREVRKLLRIGERRWDDAIRHVFLYMNYNAIGYLNYYTRYLQGQIKNVDNTSERIERLSLALKTINQTQQKSGIAYNRASPSLKEQIVDWISEEIAYQERVFQLTQKNPLAPGSLPADFKIQTDMSLSQLAYMVRIFVDSKIIQNKNLSDILRFVSKHYQVKNQNISYESFRVRYYNPEESIRKSVRGILLQLVNHIDRF